MSGVQLFYEGFWKIKTLRTPTPWTAAGYLRNAQGPLRDHFRQLAGDPDDLGLLGHLPMNHLTDKCKREVHLPSKSEEKEAWIWPRGAVQTFFRGVSRCRDQLLALQGPID